jgi:hypothetical protein
MLDRFDSKDATDLSIRREAPPEDLVVVGAAPKQVRPARE